MSLTAVLADLPALLTRPARYIPTVEPKSGVWRAPVHLLLAFLGVRPVRGSAASGTVARTYRLLHRSTILALTLLYPLNSIFLTYATLRRGEHDVLFVGLFFSDLGFALMYIVMLWLSQTGWMRFAIENEVAHEGLPASPRGHMILADVQSRMTKSVPMVLALWVGAYLFVAGTGIAYEPDDAYAVHLGAAALGRIVWLPKIVPYSVGMLTHLWVLSSHKMLSHSVQRASAEMLQQFRNEGIDSLAAIDTRFRAMAELLQRASAESQLPVSIILGLGTFAFSGCLESLLSGTTPDRYLTLPILALVIMFAVVHRILVYMSSVTELAERSVELLYLSVPADDWLRDNAELACFLTFCRQVHPGVHMYSLPIRKTTAYRFWAYIIFITAVVAVYTRYQVL